MHELLLRELGQGVDGLRMAAEPLYARDVLLVCDAMPGTELARLAQHFRVAANERPEDEAPASQPQAPASGFGASGISRLASGFGRSRPGSPAALHAQADADDAPPGQPPRRWFSPSRWLTGR